MTSEERFGFAWNKYPEMDIDYEEQFSGWTSLLKKEDFKDKTILDAGMGMGRNSLHCINSGAKKVVGFDNDDRTINAAKNTLKNFDNVEIEKKDIYLIDYNNQFDLVICIGVIHHLDCPHNAIENLIKALKPNGKLLIWVYGYQRWIVRYINPIRYVTSRLPIRLTHLISYGFSIPLYIYVKLFKHKHPYLQQLKRFTFRHILSITFDQLLPRVANYYKKEEVLDLFKNQNIKDININKVNDNSWCVVGIKEEKE